MRILIRWLLNSYGEVVWIEESKSRGRPVRSPIVLSPELSSFLNPLSLLIAYDTFFIHSLCTI